MKVVLGLSGGVDSAVCAALLRQQGHEVVGLYLENGISETGVTDARAVAERFGIPLDVLDIREALGTVLERERQAREEARNSD